MIQTHQQNILKQRYQIIEIIGKGAMGITYKAQDLQTNTNVAVKAISLRNLTSAKQLELIEREVEVLQKLNHPHIPCYLDYFEVDTENDRIFYLVQELIEGKNLEQWVKQGWRVTEKEVKAIAEQLLQVLDYLHNLEPPVIHRDIKPHNLLRTESGKIYLVDFGGIQNAYYTAFHGGSTTVGTFGYMALEQANGKAVPASDLYSLGATLLYVLTHRQPEALANGLSFDFRSHIKLSEEFADWLEKMLEADVNERFSSAKEALTALKNPKLVREGRLNPHRKLVWLGLVMMILGGVTLFQMNKWWILSSLKYPLELKLCRDEFITREFFARQKDENLRKFAADRCLLLGAETGNQKLVKQALANGADINTYANKDEKIRSIAVFPFDYPIESNNKNLSTNRSSFPQGRGRWYGDQWIWLNSTPLERAIWADDKEMVKLLIAHGADHGVNLLNIFFVKSSRYFSNSDIKSNSHYSHYTNISNVRPEESNPWIFALYYGREEMLEFLMTDCANIQIKDDEAFRHLLKATRIFKYRIPHYEPSYFHDKYLNDFQRKTLIITLIDNASDDHRFSYNKEDLVDDLNLPIGILKEDLSPLKLKKLAEILITHGADVNLQDSQGNTTLHYAVSTQKKDLINFLITNGANVNVQNHEGKTPLHYALWVGNQEIIELLKEYGAK